MPIEPTIKPADRIVHASGVAGKESATKGADTPPAKPAPMPSMGTKKP